MYRFLNEDFEVIYVGRTVNLNNRMRQHFGGKKGHLPVDCYKAVSRVDYLELNSKADMNIVELYFIGKYRPMYNTKDNTSNVSLEINELKYAWLKYDPKKSKQWYEDSIVKNDVVWAQEKVSSLEGTIKELEIKSLKQEIELEDYKRELTIAKETIINLSREVVSPKAMKEGDVEMLSAYRDVSKSVQEARSEAKKYAEKYKNLLQSVLRGDISEGA